MGLCIGVIGLGHWGKNYVRLLNEHPQVSDIYVCDIERKRVEEIVSKYPRVRAFSNYADLLGKVKINGVIISAIASTHFDIGINFLKKGVHTLIEKPLATTLKDADNLVKTANKQKCVLMVGHTFLYNNAVRKLKEITSSNSFGKIFYIVARRTHLGLIRPDVSAHWDLASHDISIINYLTGKLPKKVQCDSSTIISKSKVDAVFITLYYPDNIIANIHVSWIDANKVREVEVIGQYRKVVFNDIDPEEPVKVYNKGVEIVPEEEFSNFGEFKYILRSGKIESPHIEMVEPLKLQLNDFISAITDHRKPFADGENGRAVVKILEAVDKSIRNGGIPVYV